MGSNKDTNGVSLVRVLVDLGWVVFGFGFGNLGISVWGALCDWAAGSQRVRLLFAVSS